MIDPQYNYLLDDNMPRVIREALKLYGTKEIKGEEHNPIIIDWAQEIKPYVGIDYTNDEEAWCGLFVGVCVHRAKFTPVKICVRAKEWLKFGWESEEPQIGNILVFNRKGGGHVGFYVGEDTEYYHVLGGNQDNMVKISRIAKDRCDGIRECPWKIARPTGARRVRLDALGKISYNER